MLCVVHHPCFYLFKDVVLPEKPKLKFVNKMPNLKKAKREMKKLRDIQGPAKAANNFTTGQYAIVVSTFIICKHCCLVISAIFSHLLSLTDTLTYAKWIYLINYKLF